MHKTAAESREYVQRLLSRLPMGNGVELGLCVPFTALAATVDALGGSDVKVLAQNMHQQPEGAFTGEVSAPMITELGVHGVLLGHSERRQFFGETDRALQEKVPAALAAGLVPMLCVGETEEEHEAGDTQRKLRHQVQEALEKVPDERLPEVVIAYEPIWAIGTGPGGHAGAGAGGDRLHPRAGGRPLEGRRRARARAVRRQREARQRGRAARPARHRRRAGGRRLARPRRSRRDREGRRGAMSSVALVILDGWGLAEDGPGNAVSLADTPVFDSLWYSHPHTSLTAWGRAVGLPEGQMGNSEVGHLNLGAGAVVRQDLTRIDDAVSDGSLAGNEAIKGALEGESASPDRTGVGRWRSRLSFSPEGAHPGRLGRGGPGHRAARVHRRARHAAAFRRRLRGAGRGVAERTRAGGSARSPGATSRWTATAAGTGSSSPTTRSCTAAATRPDAASGVEAVRAAYERDETDEFVKATVVGEEARIRDGDSVLFFNFRPDRARELAGAR